MPFVEHASVNVNFAYDIHEIVHAFYLPILLVKYSKSGKVRPVHMGFGATSSTDASRTMP